MVSKTTLTRYFDPGGLCLAALYVSVVIVVFIVTAYRTKPDYVGFDWGIFILLLCPWYYLAVFLVPGFLLGWLLLFGPGFLINTWLMYLFGTRLHRFWVWWNRRRIRNSKTTWAERINPGGLCLVAFYVILIVIVVVFLVAAYLSNPEYTVYLWPPFELLAWPWFFLYSSLTLSRLSPGGPF
jgi:hypothetical protein